MWTLNVYFVFFLFIYILRLFSNISLGGEKMKKITMGILAFLVIGVVFSTAVMAYKGNVQEKSPFYSEERCSEMQNADYEKWLALMQENGRNPKIVSVLAEEDFNKLIEAKLQAKQGNPANFVQFRSELGLNNGVGPKNGMGFGKVNNQGKNLKQGQMKQMRMHK